MDMTTPHLELCHCCGVVAATGRCKGCGVAALCGSECSLTYWHAGHSVECSIIGHEYHPDKILAQMAIDEEEDAHAESTRMFVNDLAIGTAMYVENDIDQEADPMHAILLQESIESALQQISGDPLISDEYLEEGHMIADAIAGRPDRHIEDGLLERAVHWLDEHYEGPDVATHILTAPALVVLDHIQEELAQLANQCLSHAVDYTPEQLAVRQKETNELRTLYQNALALHACAWDEWIEHGSEEHADTSVFKTSTIGDAIALIENGRLARLKRAKKPRVKKAPRVKKPRVKKAPVKKGAVTQKRAAAAAARKQASAARAASRKTARDARKVTRAAKSKAGQATKTATRAKSAVNKESRAVKAVKNKELRTQRANLRKQRATEKKQKSQAAAKVQKEKRAVRKKAVNEKKGVDTRAKKEKKAADRQARQTETAANRQARKDKVAIDRAARAQQAAVVAPPPAAPASRPALTYVAPPPAAVQPTPTYAPPQRSSFFSQTPPVPAPQVVYVPRPGPVVYVPQPAAPAPQQQPLQPQQGARQTVIVQPAAPASTPTQQRPLLAEAALRLADAKSAYGMAKTEVDRDVARRRIEDAQKQFDALSPEGSVSIYPAAVPKPLSPDSDE